MAITSDPVRVCIYTKDQELNCTIRELEFQVKRGQIVDLIGTVVDQDNSPKDKSYIQASYSELTAKLGKGESRGRNWQF